MAGGGLAAATARGRMGGSGGRGLPRTRRSADGWRTHRGASGWQTHGRTRRRADARAGTRAHGRTGGLGQLGPAVRRMFSGPAGGGGAGRVVRTPPATMGAVATVGGDACPCEEVAIDPSSAAAAIWRAEAAKFSEDTDQIYQIGRQPDSSQNVTMRQGRGGGTAEGLREWGGAMEGGCESDESSTAMGKRGRSEELHHRRR